MATNEMIKWISRDKAGTTKFGAKNGKKIEYNEKLIWPRLTGCY